MKIFREVFLKKIYIGIDPSLNRIGYSVFVFNDNFDFHFYKSGVFLSKKKSDQDKIYDIYKFFLDFIFSVKKHFFNYKDFCLSLETQFVGKNPQAAFSVLTSKSIFLLLSKICEVEYFEISPRSVKKIVSGSGSATKLDVQRSILNIFKIDDNFISSDESDAMAISFASAILKS